jgi:hypothetical protein
MKETHVTSPVWIVAGGAERHHRRKIDRRAIVSKLFFSSAGLKRQEAGDARQMDVRERGHPSRRGAEPLPKRSQKTPRVSQHGDNSFARFGRTWTTVKLDRVTPRHPHLIRDRRVRGRWAGGRRRGRSLRRHCLPAQVVGGDKQVVTSFYGLIPSCHKTDKPRTIQLNGERSRCGFGLENSDFVVM